jgi:hypothetical protein
MASDNLRNRLIAAFGSDNVKKKDGKLPSEAQQQEQMLITCFERMRGLEDGKGVDIRQRVVTIGLATVIPRKDIVQGLLQLSDFVSAVRVRASLFANYLHMKMPEEGARPPEPTCNFFKQCLNLFRSAGGADAVLRGHYATFIRKTRFAPFKWVGVGNVDQAFVYQAQDMADAAKTYVKVHFKKRLQTLVRWALRMRIPRRADVKAKVYGARLHSLVVWVTGGGVGADVRGALRAKLAELDLPFTGAALRVCRDIAGWEERLGDAPSFHDMRLRLLELQRAYLHDDRRRYQAVCGELHEAHPGDGNKKVRSKLLRDTDVWGYPPPPKEASPLPVCHTGATFVRVDKS